MVDMQSRRVIQCHHISVLAELSTSRAVLGSRTHDRGRAPRTCSYTRHALPWLATRWRTLHRGLRRSGFTVTGRREEDDRSGDAHARDCSVSAYG